MRFKSSLAGVIACLLVATGWSWAQGAGTSGGISGTVTDPTGAVVAQAPVVAVEDAKGIQHRRHPG
jgi:hypothetical protein